MVRGCYQILISRTFGLIGIGSSSTRKHRCVAPGFGRNTTSSPPIVHSLLLAHVSVIRTVGLLFGVAIGSCRLDAVDGDRIDQAQSTYVGQFPIRN